MSRRALALLFDFFLDKYPRGVYNFVRGNKMEKNECNQRRLTQRDEETKKDLSKRLNIIEGQIKGINQMIAEDRYCDDVLIQIVAASQALKSLGNQILETHLKTCVRRDVQNGKTDILEDVMQVIKKLQ